MSGKPVSYVGDDAASAGLGMLNGGITGSQHPQASGAYPRNAAVGEKEAFYRPDVMAAYGKTAPQQQAAMAMAGNTPLIFDVVSSRKLFKGRTAISYTVPNMPGPAFFVKYEGAARLEVHRGMDETGVMIGHVEVPKLKGAWKIKFQLPVSTHAGGAAPPPAYAANPADQASMFSGDSSMTMVDDIPHLSGEQQFERSGWLHRRYSLSLPAVAASLGARSATFSWTRSSDHGGSKLTENWVLIEGDAQGGREVAAYTKHGFAGNGDAQLKLLLPGALDQPAMEQIVVASVAFVEMKRRESQETSLMTVLSV